MTDLTNSAHERRQEPRRRQERRDAMGRRQEDVFIISTEVMNNFDEEIDRLMDENKRLRAELARLTENAQEAVGEA